jgi:hypothetical protein
MNPDGRVVNFGVLSTNGGFRLIHAGGALELVPLPSSPWFQANIRWRDLDVEVRRTEGNGSSG